MKLEITAVHSHLGMNHLIVSLSHEVIPGDRWYMGFEIPLKVASVGDCLMFAGISLQSLIADGKNEFL